jgi:ribosomal-protein-alanine N-acetyltransferase
VPFTTYLVDVPYCGKGYENAACHFLIDYGFNRLQAYRLSGDCMSENYGSRRIMEKNGFTLEGVQKKYWLKQGKFYDNLLFGLLKN